ncbi:MAG: TonB-dependent receptor [Bacteroidota bacterium]
MSRSLLLCLLVGVFYLLGSPLAAQSLTGLVTDLDGEPLPGVNVAVVGTAMGTSTDAAGQFGLDLVPGTYTLAASLVGFETARRPVAIPADAADGDVVSLTIRLATSSVQLDEVLATADRPYSAASSRAVRAFDLGVRPTRSTQDLLRLAPGLVIAQHAGGGKAEQLFLRGFDADHGTDVALAVDGMPVNMVSHGHGQGYADLHFVMPETIEAVDVYKGPYFPGFGNFATAGAVTMTTKDHLDESLVRLEGGSFETGSVTGLVQVPTSGQHQSAYVGGHFQRSDGPFEASQDFQRFNLFGKVHAHLSPASTLAFSAGGYGAGWDASGQVPERAIDDGSITRFGAIDALEGGTTTHQHANLVYTLDGQGGSDSDLRLQAYGIRYGFKLYSNFTLFLENPEQGDMIEQTDDRTLYGLDGQLRFRRTLPFGMSGTTTLATGFRADDATVSLWQSPDRVRARQLVGADIAERNFFLWAQEELVVNRFVRMLVGVRGDYFTFDVEDRMEAFADETGLPHASGYAQQVIVSPKANLVVTPVRGLDLFANAGLGFHSNDARNVVLGQRIADLVQVREQDGLSSEEIEAELTARNYDAAQAEVTTLPRAIGTELGARWTGLGDRLTLGAAAWLLDLEQEYVFVGDAGTTELSGATRRVGIDLEARAQVLPWLALDADVTLSTGRFVDEPADADAIPLAPTRTAQGGIVVRRDGVRGSLRVRHVGDRSANETGSVTAEGATVFDAFAAYRIHDVELSLSVENVFDAAWNEAQFDTESRLSGEASPVSELHFTPGAPRTLRLGVTYLF